MRNLTLAAMIGLGGCNSDPVYFTDSVDFSFDFLQILLPVLEGDDVLHGPYVTGASFTVWVNTQRDGQSMQDWTVTSSDESVLAIESVEWTAGGNDATDFLAVTVTMVGEGAAELVVMDGDDEVDRATLEAKIPDAAELHAAAAMFVDTGGLVPTRTPEPRILTGGEATYEVRWFQDGEPLAGHGALSVVASDVQVATERTWLFEDRDWIHVFPQHDGPATLTLQSYGFDVADVTIVGVPATDVSRIEIHGGDESGAELDQWLALMAQAFDAEERPIHGVSYEWDRDGVTEYGLGDLYRYSFDPNQTVTMDARFGELSATREIHAGAGFVDSSNEVGCDAAGNAPSLLLGAAGLALLRRPRRR